MKKYRIRPNDLGRIQKKLIIYSFFIHEGVVVLLQPPFMFRQRISCRFSGFQPQASSVWKHINIIIKNQNNATQYTYRNAYYYTNDHVIFLKTEESSGDICFTLAVDNKMLIAPNNEKYIKE